jgi:hypothetical protein
MNAFIRSFWPSFILTAACSLFLLHLWWIPRIQGMPPRPGFAGFNSTYVADYGDLGSASHYLYRFGIFGMSDRLRDNDVLLLGSSHVLLGLSSSILSEKLSLLEKRPVHVYNLGVGFGDAFGFDQEVLSKNELRQKSVVVDLFMQYGEDLSPFAKRVDNANIVAAYYFVGDLWLRYADDWILDPIIPCVRFGNHAPEGAPGGLNSSSMTERFLRTTNIRSWDNGDVVELWSPTRGAVYTDTSEEADNPLKTYQSSYLLGTNMSVSLSANDQILLKEQKLSAIYTLVPFDGYQSAKIPDIAQPFVPIGSDGLTLIDEGHLTAAARNLATERLFEAMKTQGVIENWLKQ